MSRSRRLVRTLVLGLAVSALVLYVSSRVADDAWEQIVSPGARGLAKAPAPAPLPAGRLAGLLNAPNSPPEQDVKILQRLVQELCASLPDSPDPPLRSDLDFAAALAGQNPRKLTFLPRGHPALGSDGHLRDRWGTPYAFRLLGPKRFEIRSAGPDRTLATADDLVAGPES